MMDKKYVNKWTIIEAKDEDLNIRYQSSNSKGTRPFLIVDVNTQKQEFFVLPFNKKTTDRLNKLHLLELDEEFESLLNLHSSPKVVSYKKLQLVKWRGALHSKSINKIEQRKKELNIIWFNIF